MSEPAKKEGSNLGREGRGISKGVSDAKETSQKGWFSWGGVDLAKDLDDERKPYKSNKSGEKGLGGFRRKEGRIRPRC